MGRIKSVAIKNLAREMIGEHGSRFGTDFDKNKKVVDEIRKIDSKYIRNVVAGYITKEMERAKRQAA
ncbi:MAG: 30S ribosomal protein S17e [Candidatus Aenigmarchaeota archaeon]|nr:30S ribosomal protein S17e [Candidatus Aenigmarchaeota archaeon]